MELNTLLKDQQKELDPIMNLGVQSQQKQSQEEIGQKCIKRYLHPLDERLSSTKDGFVWTTLKSNSRKGELGSWRKLKTWARKHQPWRGNQEHLCIPVAVARNLKTSQCTYTSRIALECFLGRSLKRGEEARHIRDGDYSNGINNLKAGSYLCNRLDDVEKNLHLTNLNYLNENLNRLKDFIGQKIKEAPIELFSNTNRLRIRG